MNLQAKRGLCFERLRARIVLSASTFVRHPEVTVPDQFRAVAVADIDGDGDLDLIGSDSERSFWLELEGGQYIERPLPGGDFRSQSLHAADTDEDGDLDLLVGTFNPDWRGPAEETRDALVWFENTDGQGSFGEPKVVALSRLPIRRVHLADLDADGDQDILFNTGDGKGAAGTIEWLRNDGGRQYAMFQVVRIGKVGGRLGTYDFDGDGDLDVYGSFVDDTLSARDLWFERNADNTFELHEIRRGGSFGEILVDLDQDGDQDLLVLQSFRSRATWKENTGFGVFEEEVAIEGYVGGSFRLVADFDLDGRWDLIERDEGDLVLYSRFDQHGFPNRETIAKDVPVGHYQMHDMDGDGDLDVWCWFGADSKFAWIENRLEGDVNNDSQVDFVDFLVLAENFGEIVEPWSLGDVDGDAQVSFADFLILADNYRSSRLM